MADVTGIVAAAAVAEGGKPKKSASDILATARSRLDLAISALSESREDEIDDLKFYAGSPDNHWQWPADVLATRGAVQGQTIKGYSKDQLAELSTKVEDQVQFLEFLLNTVGNAQTSARDKDVIIR
jgi:uncharacterized coiled-coil protein SlyX